MIEVWTRKKRFQLSRDEDAFSSTQSDHFENIKKGLHEGEE